METVERVVKEMTESGRIQCPSCGDSRKKKHERPMGVTVDYETALYQCFHCGVSGKVSRANGRDNYLPVTPVTAEIVHESHNDKFFNEFMTHRGIDISVADRYAISGKRYFNGGGESPAIGFVYGGRDDPSAVKWRATSAKAYTQDGAARTFYGLEELPEKFDALVICEGELDVLSLQTAFMSCGTSNIGVVSVPNGAPIKIRENSRIDSSEDGKFRYVWESKDLLENAEKIILCCDDDAPGVALAEELARRIGRAKCWHVDEWPSGCKDANDVLLTKGAEALNDLIANSVPVPLVGVYQADDYRQEVSNLYKQGVGSGVSTGIDSVDELFTILPGQMSIVTGQPSSGKSSFLDWLCLGLAQRENWRFAIASFENPVPLHIAKMSEIYTQRPFFKSDRPRMTQEELDEAHDFINEHFVFLESRDGQLATIGSVIERCRAAVMRLGVRGLVIDPYNYLATSTDSSEHSSISGMLATVSSFAKSCDLHVWFVAHPQKMYPNQDGKIAVPKGHSISGSASWFSRADLGVTINRGDDDEVEVHCWKSRLKWIGKQGMTVIKYDVATGTYSDFATPDVSDLETELEDL